MRKPLVVVVFSILAGLGFLPGRAASQNPLDYLQGGPTDYFTASDGTSIAMTVCYPDNYDPQTSYPAILEMAGYENGSQGLSFDAAGNPHCTGQTTLGQLHTWFEDNVGNAPSPPLANDSDDGAMGRHFHDHYVVIHASVRGTGCSGGEFNLFSQRSALDGYEIIENYIVDNAKHPWRSNGKVGIIGHSYSGITGTWITELQPPHLTAVSVSGLIDDVYRGITYPGGIFNGLFPPEWTLAVRPAYDVLGGSIQGLVRPLRDRPAIAQQCLANIATHRRNVVEDPVLNGLFITDSEWFRARSLIYHADRITVPFHMSGAFQDEQTGPRFPHLFERISNAPAKRMFMTNGNHGTQVSPIPAADRKAWIDYWMLGTPNPFFDIANTPVSVKTLFELRNDNTTSEVKESTSFPLPDTTWTPFFVTGVNQTGSGTLSLSQPTQAGSGVYLSGTKRQLWSYEAGPEVGPPLTTRHLPDELEFRYPIPTGEPLVIAGPITANLNLSTTGTDTDLFVQVIDEYQGKLTVLQRGLLRASHAGGIEYGSAFSDYFGTDPVVGGPFLYRPWRSHTNPEVVPPLATKEYLIEVFTVAHIFRPGHTLLVKIMAPPVTDSQYAYMSSPQSKPFALNTLHFGPGALSRITLPVVGAPATVDPAGPACGSYNSVRCVSQ